MWFWHISSEKKFLNFAKAFLSIFKKSLDYHKFEIFDLTLQPDYFLRQATQIISGEINFDSILVEFICIIDKCDGSRSEPSHLSMTYFCVNMFLDI